jgi:hypothetical protein
VPLRARLIREDDRAACERFDCGPEVYQQQVARFLRELYWQPGRKPRERTILGFSPGSGNEIFGFGCWKPIRTQLDDDQSPQDAIRIPFFGVGTQYQGERNEPGHSTADDLYATVESDMRREVEGDRIIELFCVEQNERGLRFWNRQGFTDIGKFPFQSVSYRRLVRRLPPSGA